MKKTMTTLILVLLPLMLAAQADPIDKLFDKYGEKEGYTTVYISKKMFEMASAMEMDDPEVQELVKNLTRIRILASDDVEEAGVNFFDELKNDFPFGQFEELMTVHEKDQDVRFLVKEVDGKISHLVLIVGGADNALISIEGLIDLKNIGKLSSGLGIEELDHLEDSLQ
ncbi:MAG TPA: DUF4252 domain-containing protein [Bacteroidetes bacterium]|nr:DUF4252 domain-containing protein [Bacteroidota bacterium]